MDELFPTEIPPSQLFIYNVHNIYVLPRIYLKSKFDNITQ